MDDGQTTDLEHTTNVGEWIELRARAAAERPALRVAGSDETLCYGDLAERIRAAAGTLRGLGIARGDCIALALPSEPLYLVVYFAAARLGALLLPLNTRLSPAELRFQLEDSAARLLVCDPGFAIPTPDGVARCERTEFVARMGAATDPGPAVGGGEDAQVIMYTSGTTGRPKGALLPHRKTLYNTRNAEVYFGLVPDDVVVVPIPLFHSFGLKILSVPALHTGACVALVDPFDPLELQRTIASERATLLGAVPVMFRRMRDTGIDRAALASLRFAFSAGAALDVETIRDFHAQGVSVKQGYGQTETSILTCLDAADVLRKAGSVGRAVRHGEIRVADPQGRSVPIATTGEVLVRGPIVMLGYWQRPEETRESRIDGWHRTGDLGVLDEEGFLTLVGRRKELFISGGENVYPAEVERVLESHEQIVEAAVVGVADDRWGECGRAFYVSTAGDLDPVEFAQWLAPRLARYKQPRDYVRVPSLPRTASGKVQKHVLLREHPD